MQQQIWERYKWNLFQSSFTFLMMVLFQKPVFYMTILIRDLSHFVKKPANSTRLQCWRYHIWKVFHC